jgi:hypothetical protein
MVEQRAVARDLDVLEAEVREGVLQDLVLGEGVADRGDVAHDRGADVLQRRGRGAHGLQDLLQRSCWRRLSSTWRRSCSRISG